MIKTPLRAYRRVEALLLGVVLLLATLGFSLVSGARSLDAGQPVLAGIPLDLLPLLAVALPYAGLHLLLWLRGVRSDQLLLPLVAAVFSLGLTMIWRLRGVDGYWQQVLRGFLPGMLLVAVLVFRPALLDYVRRWALWVSLAGLVLAVITALFGVMDETGARLALKIGPLPPIQTSEIIKLVLVIFLAWYIEREGEAVEGRARVLFGFLRVPALRYFLPGILFVTLATLALVKMSDFGAVLILAVIFVAMLYAGFETRVFATIAAIGLALSLLVGLVLSFTWEVPVHIQYRWLAFRDPWSQAEIFINGAPTGTTIADGPGYQIQQAIYATIAGGLTGTGLGFGSPNFIPLAATDFIFAALLEEMGAMVGMALLAFYTILLLRIFRGALLLPRVLLFERLLLTGIGIHFFTQVLIMVGGTLNVLPVTGVTLPFLSLGGSALLVNLLEIGLVLAAVQRLEV